MMMMMHDDMMMTMLLRPVVLSPVCLPDCICASVALPLLLAGWAAAAALFGRRRRPYYCHDDIIKSLASKIFQQAAGQKNDQPS
jgi:hypothetical protein